MIDDSKVEGNVPVVMERSTIERRDISFLNFL